MFKFDRISQARIFGGRASIDNRHHVFESVRIPLRFLVYPRTVPLNDVVSYVLVGYNAGCHLFLGNGYCCAPRRITLSINTFKINQKSVVFLLDLDPLKFHRRRVPIDLGVL